MVNDVKRTLLLGALVVALLVAAVSGCGGHSAKKTSLELVADNGLGSKAVFHLRCDPAGGDIADPARACAALEKHPSALLHPKPFICHADYWHIAISGRFNGRAVNVKTDTCWTPQMELIDRLGIASQLDTHYVTFGTRRNSLAKRVDIPANTPAWLIAMATSEAASLQDAMPERMRIQLGRVDVIELWGHFSCVACPRPPHAKSPSGTYARITVDPHKRAVTSLSLKRAAPKGAAATKQAEANVGAAIDAIDAYFDDHHSYVGMMVRVLRKYDPNLKLDPIKPEWLGKNRFCVQSTVSGRVVSENWPPLPIGEIAYRPCSRTTLER
jgi:hypothetical protein